MKDLSEVSLTYKVYLIIGICFNIRFGFFHISSLLVIYLSIFSSINTLSNLILIPRENHLLFNFNCCIIL